MQMRKTVAVVTLLTLVAVVSCKRSEKPTTQTTATAATASSATETSRGASSEEPAKADVGAPMPAFEAVYLDDTKFDLAAKRDKVVLLNVWATWCGPCRYEIPELQKLHDQYTPRGLEVIGVSVDESGAESVRSFVADQKKMTYPIVLDAAGTIANLLETTVLPTSVLVDRNGKIVWKKYGAIMEGDAELKKAIEAAL
jgi:cytochrome c biogenesis protein CcmG, thiol:disulfide interchange protein DsbE